MKRVLTLFTKVAALAVVLVLVFSPLISSIPMASAVVNDCVIGQDILGRNADGTCPQAADGSWKSVPLADVQSGAVAAPASGDKQVADKTGSDFDTQIGYWLAQIVYVFTVPIATVAAYVGSIFLNFAVHISLNSSAYSLDFVSQGWATARDIANMGFIFILIYLAMIIMFQANTSSTMHTLVLVIVVALVINFSFFFVRVVIDGGNILAVQFYNAIVAGSNTPSVGGVSLPSNIAPDLTSSIMQGLDVQHILNTHSFQQFKDKAAESGNFGGGFFGSFIGLSLAYIGISVILCLLAAAFLAAGIKFIMRIVALWFCIIASPLALIAWAVHPLHSYYARWQKALISNTIYPVAFLFIFLMLAKFMGSFKNGFSSTFFETSDTGATGLVWIAGVLANTAVRVGFIVAMIYVAIKASESIGVSGAKAADGIGKRFGGFGLTANSFIARRVFGGAAAALNNSLPTKGRVSSTLKFGSNFVAGNRSFDVRAPLERAGLDLGLGKAVGKGGFNHDEHERKANIGKEADKIVRDQQEHANDPQAEARAQAEYRNSYPGGGAAFDARLAEIPRFIEELKKESTSLAQKGNELSQKNIDTMTDAQKEAHKIDISKNKAAQATAKNSAKAAQKEYNDMVGHGKKEVGDHHKADSQRIAIQLMASGNAAKYLAGRKMLTGKSKDAELMEAVKKATKDDDKEEEEKGGGHSAPAATPAASTASAAPAADHGGGGHPPAH